MKGSTQDRRWIPQRRVPGYEELIGLTCMGRPELNACVHDAHTPFQADKNPEITAKCSGVTRQNLVMDK